MTSAHTYANRRQVERFLMTGVTVAHVEPIGEVQLMDVSVRGARIRHVRPTIAGGEVRLKFRPAAQGMTLAFSGCVVWTEPLDPSDPDGEKMSGIQFNEEAAGLQTALERLCDAGGAMRI